MKFAYYPGCSAQSTCKELNTATRKTAEKLGLELVEHHSATCTGSRQIRAVNPGLLLALNARILAMAERDNLPLMTICNTCTLNFLGVIKTLGEDAIAREPRLFKTARPLNQRPQVAFHVAPKARPQWRAFCLAVRILDR